MLDQQNINIVDDDLAHEKHNRLHSLCIRWRLSRAGLHAQLRRDSRDKTCRNHRSRNRANRTENSIAGYYQSRAQKEADTCFKNKVRTEPGKSAYALHRATLDAERRIGRNANREKPNDPWTWNVQVGCNRFLRQKKYCTQRKAGDPRFAKQAVHYSGLAGISMISGHKLCADQLERQTDARG